MNKKVVYLSITSFIGISLGAKHYYGKLIAVEHKTVEMQYRLTEKQAKKLNEEHEWTNYRAGWLYEGFDSKEDIIKQAISEYKVHFPDAVVLVEGSPTYSGPHIILDGPDGLADEVQKLIASAVKIGWWDHMKNIKTMREITASYDGLIERATA